MKPTFQLAAVAVACALLVGAKAYSADTEDKEVYVTFDSLKDIKAKNGTTIDGSVKFVFSKDAGNVTTGDQDTGNGQTSGMGKSKEDACRWALLDAFLKFQTKAKSLNKTSVTDVETSGAGTTWTGDKAKLTCLAGAIVVRTKVRGRYN